MSDIKIGSRVRFLSDVGGGKVVGFQKGNIVLVEDEDGFQIPTLMSDVVVIETEDYNTSTMVDVKKKQKVPSLPTQEEKKAVTPSKKTPIPDDIDLEPGTIRIRKSGGPGTHNGMKSVVHNLASEKFPRIRVGIGKPVNGDLMEYVIGAIDDEDKNALNSGVELAADAVELFLKENIDIAMNKFN